MRGFVILGAALLSLIPPGDEAIATLVGEEPNAGCSGVRTLHINGVKWASPEDNKRGPDMKRRTFLRMIGLAPVAAALPAMALPRPENVKVAVGRAGFVMEATAGDHHARIGASVEYPIDYDALNRDLEGSFRWINESTRNVIAEANRIRSRG